MLDPSLTLKKGSKVKFDRSKDLQDMFSYRLTLHPKPLGPIISEEMQPKTCLPLWGTLTPPWYPWMKSLMTKFLHIESRCIYLSNIWIIKSLSLYLRRISYMKNGIFQRKNGYGGHFVFRNEARVIPRQVLLTMTIPIKFKKASSKIAACRAVTPKSLFYLTRWRRRWRCNKAKSMHPVDTKMVQLH